MDINKLFLRALQLLNDTNKEICTSSGTKHVPVNYPSVEQNIGGRNRLDQILVQCEDRAKVLRKLRAIHAHNVAPQLAALEKLELELRNGENFDLD